MIYVDECQRESAEVVSRCAEVSSKKGLDIGNYTVLCFVRHCSSMRLGFTQIETPCELMGIGPDLGTGSYRRSRRLTGVRTCSIARLTRLFCVRKEVEEKMCVWIPPKQLYGTMRELCKERAEMCKTESLFPLQDVDEEGFLPR